MHAQPRVDHRHAVDAHLAGAGRVVDGLAVTARGVEQFRIGLELRPRHVLRNNVRRQRGRLRDAARDLYAADRHRMVALVRQVVRVDRGIAQRVGRLDLDAAPAVRAQLADRGSEGREFVRAFARLVGAQRLHVKLDVGPGDVGPGAGEDGDLARRQRQRAGAVEGVLHADPQPPEVAVDLVVQGSLAGLEHQPYLQVVLQVFADAGQGMDHRHTDPREQLCRTDAGTLQQLRRTDGACGQDHFRGGAHLVAFPALDIFHADGAPAFEQHAGGLRPGLDG